MSDRPRLPDAPPPGAPKVRLTNFDHSTVGHKRHWRTARKPRERVPKRARVQGPQGPTHILRVAVPEHTWQIIQRIARYERRPYHHIVRATVVLGLWCYERLVKLVYRADTLLQHGPSPCPPVELYVMDEQIARDLTDILEAQNPLKEAYEQHEPASE